MDSVPITFCDSVCALFYMINPQKFPFCSQVWEAAASESFEKRENLMLGIGYTAGVWSYELKDCFKGLMKGRKFSFEELKRTDMHVRVGAVCLVDSSLYTQKSSLKEINQIIDYTLSYLFNPTMFIYCGQEIPKEAFSAFLARYQSVPFQNFNVRDRNNWVEEFLIRQLQSAEFMSYLDLPSSKEPFSEEFRLAIEEFAISKHFRSFHLEKTKIVFNKAFFERLFEKSSPEIRFSHRFSAEFSFNLAELKAFKPELQSDPKLSEVENSNCVRWERADGVKVDATQKARTRVIEIDLFKC